MSSPSPQLAERTDLARLLARCTFPPAGTPVVCGVSGGADSLALLVLACAAGCVVTAVHVDHGLRPEAGAEAGVVAAAAERFGARFRSERVEVAAGPNQEARARAARLAVLGDGALLGHTADDQAETLLLNLLRGSGLDGLAAMRPATHPLLDLRRRETGALCASLGLRPVADPSNLDFTYRRNAVRHGLLPLLDALAERDVAALLARQARVIRDDVELLDELAAALDPTDCRALAAAPPALARRALRRWLADPYPPGADAVERVLQVVRNERVATEVDGGRRVERTAGRLRLVGP